VSEYPTWIAADGTEFGYRIWKPEGETKAWVVAMHGLSCRAEDFEPLVDTMNRAGIAIAAWNLRGQGLDPQKSRRGAWLEVDGMLEDLEGFANFIGADRVFLAGESMGALLALQAAARQPWRDRAMGLLLFAPVVALAQRNPPWVKTVLRVISRLAPGASLKPSWFVHGKGSFPKLTRIPERQHELETAPYRLGPLTLGFLARMGDLIDASDAAAQRLDVPVALFSAGHDVFISAGQTRAFFEKIRTSEKSHFEFPESYHQLLFDLDAPTIADEATKWITARLRADTSRQSVPNISR